MKVNVVEDREYQSNIASSCLRLSTLVVLPTGMGKTIIALRVIASQLQNHPDRKVLFMATTKPLVEQHAAFLRGMTKMKDIIVFTGEVAPAKREQQIRDNHIIVATPQVIRNDIISGKLDMKEFGLVIYDEVHRATGDYAYVFVAEKYNVHGRLRMGMTASPGGNVEKILEVCQNIGIENVEIRSKYDPDVIKYVHEIKLKWIDVVLPADYISILKLLNMVYDDYFKKLKGYGFLTGRKRMKTGELLEIGRTIRVKLKTAKEPAMFHAASVQAAAVKINHGIERIETQGVDAFKEYMFRIQDKATGKGGSKADKMLMNDERVKRAISLANVTDQRHPKIGKVVETVEKQLAKKADSRIIVFTHYRDTSDLVASTLDAMNKARPVRFVGQASRGKDKGLRQKQQVQVLQDFKDGKYNVLVATSVAEEGLDIPETDLVVFYEPVPSEIRTIQRRGRTGRKRAGEVIILKAKNTRDEAYYWSSRHKEKNMHSELDTLKRLLAERDLLSDMPTGPASIPGEGPPTNVAEAGSLSNGSSASIQEKSAVEKIADRVDAKESRNSKVSRDTSSHRGGDLDDSSFRQGSNLDDATKVGKKKAGKQQRQPIMGLAGQMSLGDFKKTDELDIVCDTREFNSEVVRELSRMDVVVRPHQLAVGDYVLSDRVCVERKEGADFLTSLMDGRLFDQIKRMRESYLAPLLVIEGDEPLTARNVSPGAVYGALGSILTDFRIPVMFTKDGKETAVLLKAIAARERKEDRPLKLRGEKGSMAMHERQQYIVEGLPNVSGTMAQRLLSYFGTIQALSQADEKELCKVKGVGKKTAKDIMKVFKAMYIGGESEKGKEQ
jgi:Fanconi anemia group M protein